MTNAEALVTERGKTHGKFSDRARIATLLKNVIDDELIQRAHRGQTPLDYQHIEALSMIVHKISRIIAGDPSFQDHWDDIAGYATIANKDFGS